MRKHVIQWPSVSQLGQDRMILEKLRIMDLLSVWQHHHKDRAHVLKLQ